MDPESLPDLAREYWPDLYSGYADLDGCFGRGRREDENTSEGDI